MLIINLAQGRVIRGQGTSTREAEAVQEVLCDFKDSLVYRASSGIAGARKRNPVLKNRIKQKSKSEKGHMVQPCAFSLLIF